MNCKLLGRKTEKHESQILCCDGELKVDEYWMSRAEQTDRQTDRQTEATQTLDCASEQAP